MLNTNLSLDRRDAALRQQLATSLGWLTRNLECFTPWREERLTDSGVKAFAELAIVYAHLEQWQKKTTFVPYLSLSGMLLTWREFILQHCEHSLYAEMARKRPAYAFHLLVPYLVLRATGYRSPYYEDILRHLRRWGYPEVTEVVPYRLLDRQYFLWKAGYMEREPNWYRLYRDTALAHVRNLVYLDKETTYSITHTLLYLTDLGNRPVPLKVTEVERITAIIECLLLHYWRLAHWDLTGELLVALNCLNETSSFVYASAARAFQRAFRSGGYIPADHIEEERLRLARGHKRDALIFSTCYHSTLVGILYFSTAQNEVCL